ncbi:hypothetical protein ANCCAN_28909 [Ancylostoma caninum]|uniref:Uncharacterized protein n=1 Tax=Ancylostoma caninum TaxID=29170 RepID=A0A368F2Z1_ANCCA|nr:hypothetical protein ANCCAN_28909 [Ancylostoma caninum]
MAQNGGMFKSVTTKRSRSVYYLTSCVAIISTASQTLVQDVWRCSRYGKAAFSMTTNKYALLLTDKEFN